MKRSIICTLVKKSAKVAMNLLYIINRRISTITWIMYKEKYLFLNWAFKTKLLYFICLIFKIILIFQIPLSAQLHIYLSIYIHNWKDIHIYIYTVEVNLNVRMKIFTFQNFFRKNASPNITSLTIVKLCIMI